MLAPAAEKAILEARLAGEPGIGICREDPEVLVLAGPDWQARLETAREGRGEAALPVVLVTRGEATDLEAALAAGVRAWARQPGGAHARDGAV